MLQIHLQKKIPRVRSFGQIKKMQQALSNLFFYSFWTRVCQQELYNKPPIFTILKNNFHKTKC